MFGKPPSMTDLLDDIAAVDADSLAARQNLHQPIMKFFTENVVHGRHTTDSLRLPGAQGRRRRDWRPVGPLPQRQRSRLPVGERLLNQNYG